MTSRGQQAGGHMRIGRQVEIGEQDLTRSEHLDLGVLRFLDLEDHLGPSENLPGVGNDGGPLGLELIVDDGRSFAGALLDENGMAALGQLAGADRGDGHAVLFGLDFLGDTDDQDTSSLTYGTIAGRLSAQSRPCLTR